MIKPRLRIKAKLLLFSQIFGFFLVALSLWVVYLEYQQLVIAQSNKELMQTVYVMADRFSEKVLHIKDELLFVVNNNFAVRDFIEENDNAYASKSDEDNLARIMSIDRIWDKGGWDQLKEGMVNNPVTSVLRSLPGVRYLPLSEIFVTDRLGALVATTHKTSDYYQADEEWWQKAFNGGAGNFYLSPIEFDESLGVRSFVIAAPIFNKNNVVIGVLKAVVSQKECFDEIFDYPLSEGMSLAIITSKGFKVYSTHALDEILFKNLWGYIYFQQGKGIKTVSNAKKQKFVIGYATIENNLLSRDADWVLCYLKDSSHLFPTLNQFLVRFSFMGLVILLLVYLAVLWGAKKLTEPVNKLKNALESVRRGQLNQKVDICTHDEFEEVGEDFNLVLDQLCKERVSLNYFDGVIQNMSDILFVVTPYGKIDFINKSACQLLGYVQRELKGQEASKIFSKKDRYIISWGLKGLIEEGALKDKKVELLTKKGREFEVYLGTRSIRNTENQLLGLVCVAKDLTEINELLGQLRKSNEKIIKQREELRESLKELMENRDVMMSILSDTDESKRALESTLQKLEDTQDQLLHAEKLISMGQIAAGVAHEINNPLFVISGEAEMLGMEENMPPSAIEAIKIIRQQVLRIEEITKRLLDFSRKRSPQQTVINMHLLLDKAVDLLGYQIKQVDNIRVVREFTQEELKVRGDFTQLQEVFLNLMLNAVQAMESKGGILTVKTFSEIIRKPEKIPGGKFPFGAKVVKVLVSDTGMGIDKERIRRVFDPFFTTKKTGTGLGLSVCYGIVESHKGIIEVESEKDKGTTFIVRMLLAEE